MGLFDTIGGFLEDGVELVTTPIGNAFKVGSTLVIDGINDVGMGLRELARGALGIRRLRPPEISLAQEVFDNTLPYHRIVVCSLGGLGGKPFTLPGTMLIGAEFMVPGVGTLLAVASIVGSLQDKYVLFLGEQGYNNALLTDTPRKRVGQQFLHELTHVWQGDVGAFQWAYVGDSIAQRCLHAFSDDGPYDYKTGKNWSEYHAEQQANIVDDFWKETELMVVDPQKHRNYPYIRDNILRRDPYAPYVPPPSTAPTLHQLTIMIETLRTQKAALLPFQFQPAIATQIQVLDVQIAQYQSLMMAVYGKHGRIIAQPTVNPPPPPRVIAKPTVNPK